MTTLSRRSFLVGAVAAGVCAPAIVRAASLMPVRAFEDEIEYNALVYGGAFGSELVAITRKAFIPRLFMQLYKTPPLLAVLADLERKRELEHKLIFGAVKC